MPVQAVIFDFGGVLVFPPDEAKIQRAADACGLPRDEFWEAFWAPRLDYDAGKVEPETYWWAVHATGGKEFDPALLPSLIRHEVEFWNHFDQRVLDWVDQIRQAGLRTAILSNLPRVLGEELRATPGFLDHFDQVTFSYEVKAVKPEPAIYQHAVQGLGVEAPHALFIDDKQQNVAGARELGLQTELFTTWEAFLAGRVAERYGLPAPR